MRPTVCRPGPSGTMGPSPGPSGTGLASTRKNIVAGSGRWRSPRGTVPLPLPSSCGTRRGGWFRTRTRRRTWWSRWPWRGLLRGFRPGPPLGSGNTGPRASPLRSTRRRATCSPHLRPSNHQHRSRTPVQLPYGGTGQAWRRGREGGSPFRSGHMNHLPPPLRRRALRRQRRGAGGLVTSSRIAL